VAIGALVRYKGGMIGVVLVAGVSRRLYPMTKNRPKCLLEVGNQTIFDHQMHSLKAVGVREVCLITGYRREQILAHVAVHHPELRVRTVVNHHFFENNTAASLWIAGEEFLDRDMILLNGDVLFDPRVLEKVVNGGHTANLAVEAKPCGDEEVKVVVDGDERVRRIGKLLDPAQCRGEYIGVAMFAAPFSTHLFESLDRLMHTDEGDQAYYERAMDDLLDTHDVAAIDVTGLPCVEIDFPADYENARRNVYPRMGR
jgi:choline kinase